MEPEAHRHDREAMLADRTAVAERVTREVDEIVAAAARARQAYLDERIARMRVEAGVAEDRVAKIEREADEIVAKARAEVDRLLAETDEERQRVRELLTGALASLGAAAPAGSEAAAPSESLASDLAARLPETATDPLVG